MGVLKGLIIAVTGTLSADTSQLKKWIEANDGRYSPHIRKGVTHLIASKDAWKDATDPVQAATKVGAFIISYDWLEDSLQKRRKLAENKYTWEYLWRERKRRQQMKKLGVLADAKKFKDGCEEARKATGTGTSRSRTVSRKPKPSRSFFFADVVDVPFVSAADDLKRRREEREAAKAEKASETAAKKVEHGKSDRAVSFTTSTARPLSSNTEHLSTPSSATSHALSTTIFPTTSPPDEPQAKKPSLKDLYHYYLDITGFEYKVILTRCNLAANQVTRYRLSILESHTKPHVYCTFVEYFPLGAGIAGSGEAACFQALMDYNTTFVEGISEELDTTKASTQNAEDVQNTTLQTNHTSPQHEHPEAARLHSLFAPTSTPSTPYKTLLAPMSSTFATAWLTFRHTFRDLTLLSWEERLDTSKSIYKTRAAHFAIEPFVYVRPKNGLPLGLRVQEPGLFQNQTLSRMDEEGNIITKREGGLMTEHGNDEAYTYNAFSLPALSHPLGSGIVGTAVQNDIEAARKAEQRQKLLAEEAEEVRLGRLGRARKPERKPNYSKPLFNGITGRPTTDAWGRTRKGEGGRGAGNGGTGLLGGGVVKRKLFPSERTSTWE